MNTPLEQAHLDIHENDGGPDPAPSAGPLPSNAAILGVLLGIVLAAVTFYILFGGGL